MFRIAKTIFKENDVIGLTLSTLNLQLPRQCVIAKRRGTKINRTEIYILDRNFNNTHNVFKKI